MKRFSLAFATGALALLPCAGTAQTEGPPHRGGAGAGMGVVWMSRPDLVDLVNATPGALEGAPTFKTGAEFFGFLTVSLSRTWGVKAEYAYQLASYNIDAASGTAEYAIAVHQPSLILQRVLVLEEAYTVTAGAGGGPRFGSLSARYLYIENTYTAAGPGFLLDIEANTILGTDLFVHIGAQVRWESGGDLEDSSGLPPGSTSTQTATSLGGFGVAFRLGLTWYLF